MVGYWQLLPEALVLIGALLALFGEFMPGGDRGAVRIGAGLAFAAAMILVLDGGSGTLFGGMLTFDGPARFLRAGVAGLTGLWLLWLSGREISPDEPRRRDAAALALFSAIGGMLLAASTDLITMYMALELSTMPAYVLVGYRRRDISGLEGALKYFLLSLLTSLIMLYGLSFLYGATGATLFADISLTNTGALGLVAALLTMVGLLAKLSAAPFHFWAPDAYAGAPASTVAFVSTVPKIAGAATLVRLMQVMLPDQPQLRWILLVAAVVSMLLGNLSALPQSDIRRLMAYSGVAHTGYLLLALSSGTPYGYGAVLYYAVAYAVPSLAIMLVVAEEGPAVTDMAQLASRRPAVAWAVVIWLMSLIGIPPLAGFFGKLYLFRAPLEAATTSWPIAAVVVAILVSVVSAGYYFRIIREMFLAPEPESPSAVPVSVASSAAIGIAVVATVGMGIAIAPLLELVGL